MSAAGSPAHEGLGEARLRTVLCWLPLATGAAVLALCWIAMALMLGVNGGSCFGGFGTSGLEAAGNTLAHDIGIWDDRGFGAALALLIYAGVSLAPFLLLSGCVRLAARSRTTRFLAVLAIAGTVLVALYDVLGYWAAYSDLEHGGFLCSLAFELVPIGGVIAGACAITVGGLAAFVIERLHRARG